MRAVSKRQSGRLVGRQVDKPMQALFMNELHFVHDPDWQRLGAGGERWRVSGKLSIAPWPGALPGIRHRGGYLSKDARPHLLISKIEPCNLRFLRA